MLAAPLQIYFCYLGLALPIRFLRVTSPVFALSFACHALCFSLALRGTLDISCAGPTLTQSLPVFEVHTSGQHSGWFVKDNEAQLVY